jgi:hypothetical protein
MSLCGDSWFDGEAHTVCIINCKCEFSEGALMLPLAEGPEDSEVY